MRGRVCTIKLYWTVLSVQWVVMFAYQATAIEYGNQTAAGHEKRFSSYSCLSRKLTGANNNKRRLQNIQAKLCNHDSVSESA